MPSHPTTPPSANDGANRNWRRFVWFRVLFNARFYYPVLAVFFLDLGLSATQYTLLNFAWALAIVAVDLPAGVLADRIGRRPLVVAAAVSMVVEMVLLCVALLGGGTILFVFVWPTGSSPGRLKAWQAARTRRWSSTRWPSADASRSGRACSTKSCAGNRWVSWWRCSWAERFTIRVF